MDQGEISPEKREVAQEAEHKKWKKLNPRKLDVQTQEDEGGLAWSPTTLTDQKSPVKNFSKIFNFFVEFDKSCNKHPSSSARRWSPRSPTPFSPGCQIDPKADRSAQNTRREDPFPLQIHGPKGKRDH